MNYATKFQALLQVSSQGGRLLAKIGGVSGCDGSVGKQIRSGVGIVGFRCKWTIELKCCNHGISAAVCIGLGTFCFGQDSKEDEKRQKKCEMSDNVLSD